MRRTHLLLSALILSALALPALAGDTIELLSGRVIRGRIEREEKDWIGIRNETGVLWVERAKIKTLTRTRPTPEPAPEPAPAPTGRAETPPAKDRPARSEQPRPVIGRDDGEAAQRARSADAEGASARPALPPPPRDGDVGDATREDLRLVQMLGSTDEKERVRATEWILETWPRCQPVLAAGLRVPEVQCRVEVVRLLDREELEDVETLLDIALGDAEAAVRVTAVRVVRHRGLAGFELPLVGLMNDDPVWSVRQEAIRTLEDLGTELCLPHVLGAWTRESDKDRRRRYTRVLRALLAEDFGDDEAGWRRAADEIFMGDRQIRGGKPE